MKDCVIACTWSEEDGKERPPQSKPVLGCPAWNNPSMHCAYLWIHPSLQSHTWFLEVPHTAQEVDKSGPHDGSKSQVFVRNGDIQYL